MPYRLALFPASTIGAMFATVIGIKFAGPFPLTSWENRSQTTCALRYKPSDILRFPVYPVPKSIQSMISSGRFKLCRYSLRWPLVLGAVVAKTAVYLCAPFRFCCKRMPRRPLKLTFVMSSLMLYLYIPCLMADTGADNIHLSCSVQNLCDLLVSALNTVTQPDRAALPYLLHAR